jgi:FkbM family methyltransferase
MTVFSSLRSQVGRLLPQSLKDRVKTSLGLPLGFLHDDWRILAGVGQTTGPHVVLDVGAYHGWFAHCWLNWCRGGVVYAFEPTPASFATLCKLYGHDPRIRPVQAGVGAVAGRLRLKVHEGAAVCNSFLPTRSENWQRIRYQEHPISEIEVEVLTLDDFCTRERIDAVRMIKIDVQGYERHVIQGATRTLARTDFVLVEAGILKLYEGASSFGAIVDQMSDLGFHLFDLRAWHRGNRVLVEADLLFQRNALAPPVSTEGDRWYVSLQ